MKITLIAAALVLLGEAPAYAYLDPGTGSLIYQTALALFLGLGFALRKGRTSISRFMRRLTGRAADPEIARDDRG
jgi:hypothetical protein